MELTILMPCLNEAESLAFCIEEAKAFLEEMQVDGEILVADNGSTDGSAPLAIASGARVITVTHRGYGAALRSGIQAAKGMFVIMGDCDGSYDFRHLEPYLTSLRNGADLVVGDRYQKGFEAGASPWIHRRIGVPFLSAMGRRAQKRYNPPKEYLVHDFHCGLRGVQRGSFLELDCMADGMEFASEMILRATKQGQKISQVPAGLRRDLRKTTKAHIRTVRDGMRHLKLILYFGIFKNERE